MRHGSGQLGYGDGDEATVLSFGPDAKNKYITTYFRHTFDVLSLSSEPLRLRIQRDDGVVVYMNGKEVFRDNMPGGVISFDTEATSGVGGEAESRFLTTLIDTGALRIGLSLSGITHRMPKALTIQIPRGD